jgi:dihydropyrimidinase
MYDLIVSGGTAVTPYGVGFYDVGVQGEKIATVAVAGTLADAKNKVDACGKIVLPGGIEPHAHLAHYISMHPEEEFYTLGPEEDTIGMAFGGTTTHVDFCFVRPGIDLAAAIEARMSRWKAQSYIDYAFHVTFQGLIDRSVFDQIPEAIQEGFPSFKVFTADLLPPHPRRHSYRLDFGRIQLAMEKIAAHGGILAVHAEDHDTVQFLYEKLRQEHKIEGWNLSLIHNNLSELLSFRRMIDLAEATGAAIYFVHTSAREGVEAVVEAHSRGLPVYAETLHQYLCFTAEDYKKPRGLCYHTYPSLKYPEDQEALWKGLICGSVSTIGTDELPTSLAIKLHGNTVEDVTGGNLGAEARMGIMFTEGVVKRGMGLERFAQITATNAARILGLYPRKGMIAPGSDADLAIIDPAIHKLLTKKDFHVSDYSPWEGWEVHGWPVTTVLRGKIIVEDGRLLGNSGDGQFIARKLDPEIVRRYAI